MSFAFKIFTRLIVAISIVFFFSCCRKNAPQKSQPVNRQLSNKTTLISPEPNTIITCGDSVKITLSQPANNVRIDSIVVYAGRTKSLAFSGNKNTVYWGSGSSRVGQIALKVMVYYNDSLTESHLVNLVVLSNITPYPYDYRVIKQYPHDPEAYTQGLIYDDGILFESTGLQGKSSLRTVEIKTGKPQKMVALNTDFFGEGISIYNDLIYQITYTSQIGFVYDKKTLEQIRSFDYQFKEGWGLTTDGKHLIMSDGSSQLFFIEPDFFTQVDKIDIFDNKGMIDSLNELEYIKGKILANVYGQSYIIIIDPLTGKVTGKIDLLDLMPKGSIGDYGKALNGIAFNPQTGHLYVTGKDWPVLYEIELIPSL